jgi:hypothetical protein
VMVYDVVWCGVMGYGVVWCYGVWCGHRNTRGYYFWSEATVFSVGRIRFCLLN